MAYGPPYAEPVRLGEELAIWSQCYDFTRGGSLVLDTLDPRVDALETPKVANG